MLKKLTISGVRSYSDDNPQEIEFFKPVTIILGKNGSGKSVCCPYYPLVAQLYSKTAKISTNSSNTILESIQYILTGTLPPLSDQGKRFVHDPLLEHRTITRARIQLLCSTYGGHDLLLTSRFEVNAHNGKKSFKALDMTTSIVDPTSHSGNTMANTNPTIQRVLQTQGRAKDGQANIPLLLGVNTALMQYSLFTHFEDSHWPLSEDSKVKSRFDSIFVSDKYNDALIQLKNIRKDAVDQEKDDIRTIDVLRSRLEMSQQISTDIARTKASHTTIRSKCQYWVNICTQIKNMRDTYHTYIKLSVSPSSSSSLNTVILHNSNTSIKPPLPSPYRLYILLSQHISSLLSSIVSSSSSIPSSTSSSSPITLLSSCQTISPSSILSDIDRIVSLLDDRISTLISTHIVHITHSIDDSNDDINNGISRSPNINQDDTAKEQSDKISINPSQPINKQYMMDKVPGLSRFLSCEHALRLSPSSSHSTKMGQYSLLLSSNIDNIDPLLSYKSIITLLSSLKSDLSRIDLKYKYMITLQESIQTIMNDTNDQMHVYKELVTSSQDAIKPIAQGLDMLDKHTYEYTEMIASLSYKLSSTCDNISSQTGPSLMFISLRQNPHNDDNSNEMITSQQQPQPTSQSSLLQDVPLSSSLQPPSSFIDDAVSVSSNIPFALPWPTLISQLSIVFTSLGGTNAAPASYKHIFDLDHYLFDEYYAFIQSQQQDMASLPSCSLSWSPGKLPSPLPSSTGTTTITNTNDPTLINDTIVSRLFQALSTLSKSTIALRFDPNKRTDSPSELQYNISLLVDHKHDIWPDIVSIIDYIAKYSVVHGSTATTTEINRATDISNLEIKPLTLSELDNILEKNDNTTPHISSLPPSHHSFSQTLPSPQHPLTCACLLSLLAVFLLSEDYSPSSDSSVSLPPRQHPVSSHPIITLYQDFNKFICQSQDDTLSSLYNYSNTILINSHKESSLILSFKQQEKHSIQKELMTLQNQINILNQSSDKNINDKTSTTSTTTTTTTTSTTPPDNHNALYTLYIQQLSHVLDIFSPILVSIQHDILSYIETAAEPPLVKSAQFSNIEQLSTASSPYTYLANLITIILLEQKYTPHQSAIKDSAQTLYSTTLSLIQCLPDSTLSSLNSLVSTNPLPDYQEWQNIVLSMPDTQSPTSSYLSTCHQILSFVETLATICEPSLHMSISPSSSSNQSQSISLPFTPLHPALPCTTSLYIDPTSFDVVSLSSALSKYISALIDTSLAIVCTDSLPKLSSITIPALPLTTPMPCDIPFHDTPSTISLHQYKVADKYIHDPTLLNISFIMYQSSSFSHNDTQNMLPLLSFHESTVFNDIISGHGSNQFTSQSWNYPLFPEHSVSFSILPSTDSSCPFTLSFHVPSLDTSSIFLFLEESIEYAKTILSSHRLESPSPESVQSLLHRQCIKHVPPSLISQPSSSSPSSQSSPSSSRISPPTLSSLLSCDDIFKDPYGVFDIVQHLETYMHDLTLLHNIFDMSPISPASHHNRNSQQQQHQQQHDIMTLSSKLISSELSTLIQWTVSSQTFLTQCDKHLVTSQSVAKQTLQELSKLEGQYNSTLSKLNTQHVDWVSLLNLDKSSDHYDTLVQSLPHITILDLVDYLYAYKVPLSSHSSPISSSGQLPSPPRSTSHSSSKLIYPSDLAATAISKLSSLSHFVNLQTSYARGREDTLSEILALFTQYLSGDNSTSVLSTISQQISAQLESAQQTRQRLESHLDTSYSDQLRDNNPLNGQSSSIIHDIHQQLYNIIHTSSSSSHDNNNNTNPHNNTDSIPILLSLSDILPCISSSSHILSALISTIRQQQIPLSSLSQISSTLSSLQSTYTIQNNIISIYTSIYTQYNIYYTHYISSLKQYIIPLYNIYIQYKTYYTSIIDKYTIYISNVLQTFIQSIKSLYTPLILHTQQINITNTAATTTTTNNNDTSSRQLLSKDIITRSPTMIHTSLIYIIYILSLSKTSSSSSSHPLSNIISYLSSLSTFSSSSSSSLSFAECNLVDSIDRYSTLTSEYLSVYTSLIDTLTKTQYIITQELLHQRQISDDKIKLLSLQHQHTRLTHTLSSIDSIVIYHTHRIEYINKINIYNTQYILSYYKSIYIQCNTLYNTIISPSLPIIISNINQIHTIVDDLYKLTKSKLSTTTTTTTMASSSSSSSPHNIHTNNNTIPYTLTLFINTIQYYIYTQYNNGSTDTHILSSLLDQYDIYDEWLHIINIYINNIIHYNHIYYDIITRIIPCYCDIIILSSYIQYYDYILYNIYLIPSFTMAQYYINHDDDFANIPSHETLPKGISFQTLYPYLVLSPLSSSSSVDVSNMDNNNIDCDDDNNNNDIKSLCPNKKRTRNTSYYDDISIKDENIEQEQGQRPHEQQQASSRQRSDCNNNDQKYVQLEQTSSVSPSSLSQTTMHLYMNVSQLLICHKDLLSEVDKCIIWLANKSSSILHRYHGSLSHIESSLEHLNNTIQQYDGITTEYRVSQSKLLLTRKTLYDITILSKSLDQAIIQYHDIKLQQFNTCLGILWRKCYHFNDINDIYIKSDCDNTINIDNNISINSDSDDDTATTTTTTKRGGGKKTTTKGGKALTAAQKRTQQNKNGNINDNTNNNDLLSTISHQRKKYTYRLCSLQHGVETDLRGRCSAGQRALISLLVRLALAYTFCLQCVLTLDEPTTNMDYIHIESLSDIIYELSQENNIQFIIITHDQRFVDLLGQRGLSDNYYTVHKNEHAHSIISLVQFNE